MSNVTIQEAWAYGSSRLAQASFMPELDARLLVEAALQRAHSYLIAHGDELLPAAAVVQYEALLARAAAGEPIPYLLGEAPFFGLTLQVSSAVLIPRPETEQLVERVLAWAGEQTALEILDVGTGSGCIAISLARHLPAARITAVDTSWDALAVAQANARRLTPNRVRFLQSDLLSALTERYDVIVANLPYVADDEWDVVDESVKGYEPLSALQGGADGLDLIRRLLPQAANRLNEGGALFLEIGWQQGPAVAQLAQATFSAAEIAVHKDYAGHDRFVQINTAT